MINQIEFEKLCEYISKHHERITSDKEVLRSIWHEAGKLNVFKNTSREESIIILDIMNKYGIYDFPFWLQRDVLLPLFERNASDFQKNLYLEKIKKGELICALAITEETGGSSFDNITSKAILDNDQFTISCKKNVVTNATIADLFFLVVKGNNNDLCLFLIDKAVHQIEIKNTITVSEVNGLSIGAVSCNELVVGKEYKVGELGAIQLSITYFLAIERFCCATLALGICREIQSNIIKWLKARDKKRRYTSIWFELGDYYTSLQQCELLYNKVEREFIEKHNLFYSAAILKYSVIKLLLNLSTSVARICGCYSIDMHSSIETIKYRNLAYAYAAAGGTQEVMLKIINRYIQKHI